MIEPDGLVNLYGRAAARITKALLAVNPARYSAAAASQALLKTKATVKALNEAAAEWGDRAIDSAWAQGARTAKTALEILGKKPVHPARNDPRRALKDALAETLIKANASINSVAASYLTLTAMGAKTIAGAELQEFDPEGVREQMADLATKAVKNESSRKTLAGQIRSSLSSEISAGNIIEINGKAWRADRYADMVARTTLREAQTEATLELCKEYENDLVQWSDHGTVCMACHEYEGNIYSISGKHPTYPALTESPPLHPNCEHSLLPTTDVALDLRKAGPGKAGWLEGAAWMNTAGQAALKKAAAPKPPREKKPKGPRAVDPKAKWQPATSIKEAEQWAKDYLCSGPVSYKACDLDIANLINQELDFIRQFGYKLDRIRPTDSGRAVMYVWNHPIRLGPINPATGKKTMINGIEMTYNPYYMKDMKTLHASLERLNSAKAILGETPEGLVQHELAHALDDLWQRAQGIKYWERKSRSQVLWDNWKAGFTTNQERWAAEKIVQDNISGSYMWCNRKTGGKNVQEFFAEAYRLYRKGSLPANMDILKGLFESWGW